MSQQAEDKPKPSKGRLVKPENTLKKKVGHGGFDTKVLEKAQDMIENNTIDFKPIALDYSAKLADIISGSRDGSVANEDFVNQVMYPAMQLRAQGTLFHYPIITKISHVMVDFLEDNSEMDEDIVEIVEGYKKSVTAFATMEIKDADNPVGIELCDALAAACDRYYKMKASR